MKRVKVLAACCLAAALGCIFVGLTLDIHRHICADDGENADPAPPTPIAIFDVDSERLNAIHSEVHDLEAQVLELAKAPVYRYTTKPFKLRASRFADLGDKWSGSSSACKLPHRHRKITPDDHIVAHRTWRCHQEVEVCYRDMCTRAIVGDRGPYGCILHGDAEPFSGGHCRQRRDGRTWCLSVKPRDDCEYRGDIDLGASVANAVGVTGLKWVRVRKVEIQK